MATPSRRSTPDGRLVAHADFALRRACRFDFFCVFEFREARLELAEVPLQLLELVRDAVAARRSGL